MPLFKPRAARTFGQASVRVATPDGKCPVCRVGEPDKDGKMMLGSVEIAACARCKGLMFNGLSMARGLAKLAGWIRTKGRSEW